MATEHSLATIYQNGTVMRQRFVRTFVSTLVLIAIMAVSVNVEAIPFQVFGFLLVFMLATGVIAILSLVRVLFTGRARLDILSDGVTYTQMGTLVLPRKQVTRCTWDAIQNIDIQAGRATDKTPNDVRGSSMIKASYQLLVGDPETATVTVKTADEAITLKEATGDLDFVFLQMPTLLAEKRTEAIIATLDAGNIATISDLIVTTEDIRLDAHRIAWDDLMYTMYKKRHGIDYVIHRRADKEKLTTLGTVDGQVFAEVLAHFDPR